MQNIKRVFVTGCNRGLGREFVQLVAEKHSYLELHITSRQQEDKLASDLQQALPQLKPHCYQLDIGSSNSIKKNVAALQEKKITFDIIVANAGKGGMTEDPKEAADYVQTNVDATIDFINQFVPLLAPSGRIVVVSSILGNLDAQSQYMKEKLTNPNITEEEILGLAKEYIEAFNKKKLDKYCNNAYFTSKALLNAWVRYVLPKKLKEGQTCVAMHPGWCQTDMGGKNAPETPRDGAEKIRDACFVEKVEKDRFYNKGFVSYDSCQ